jgi:hypothetical protein
MRQIPGLNAGKEETAQRHVAGGQQRHAYIAAGYKQVTDWSSYICFSEFFPSVLTQLDTIFSQLLGFILNPQTCELSTAGGAM